MPSRENTVILAAAIATVVALAALGLVESTVGVPGQWVVVLAFLVFVGIGYVLPQVYLLRIDESTSQTSRLGVITLMLVVVAAMASGTVTGTELGAIWAIVVVAVALVVGSELRAGYRESQDG